MTTRVLLADDHRIVLDGLRMVLERLPGLEVAGTAGDGEEAVRLARRLGPDIVILDIVMPRLNGIEATRQILAERPETRVIALSMHADRRYVREMLAAGARGYLLKDCAAEELARAVQAVQSGHVWLSPAVAGVVVEEYARGTPRGAAGAFDVLTGREREVLQLLAEGCTARDIGQRLCLSVKTVETHRRQIMSKLGLRSLAELTKYAIREGLTSLDS